MNGKYRIFDVVLYLDGTTAWFFFVVADDNRTVLFNLTNLIQIWRQTLNRTHFVEMFCALTETACKGFWDKEHIAL
ncbi:hypothetical protein T02_10223 [Trichinella nativa]|uniref:Uncharacterized protein n=1 Tax=Trichinella nativa TaxID=6335 RepID=A0A0V1KPI4_9BILA|nr:hypothetical protein T02_10223 [Trichinella nativa]